MFIIFFFFFFLAVDSIKHLQGNLPINLQAYDEYVLKFSKTYHVYIASVSSALLTCRVSQNILCFIPHCPM